MPRGECGMTTGATIHTVGGLHLKLKRRPGTGGAEMCDYSSSECGDAGASLDQLSELGAFEGTPEAPNASFDVEELVRPDGIIHVSVWCNRPTQNIPLIDMVIFTKRQAFCLIPRGP